MIYQYKANYEQSINIIMFIFLFWYNIDMEKLYWIVGSIEDADLLRSLNIEYSHYDHETSMFIHCVIVDINVIDEYWHYFYWGLETKDRALSTHG